MRLYFLMSLLPCIAFGAERSVSPVGFSESKEGVPAFSPSGAVTLPAVSLRLDVIHLDGKKERCYLTVVYDPQNGYYFARYAPPNAPGDDTDYVIKALRSQMATVYADATGLYVSSSPTRFGYVSPHRGLTASRLPSAPTFTKWSRAARTS